MVELVSTSAKKGSRFLVNVYRHFFIFKIKKHVALQANEVQRTGRSVYFISVYFSSVYFISVQFISQGVLSELSSVPRHCGKNLEQSAIRSDVFTVSENI